MAPASRHLSLYAALCIAACGGTKSAYERHADEAQAAYGRSQYATAAEHWKRASETTESRRDRDEARYRAAMSLMRAGRSEAARRLLEQLARSGGNSRSARARFDLAFFEVEHGDIERGHDMLLSAILDFPDHGVARDALRRRRAHLVETRGANLAQSDLEALAAQLRGSELESTALFERAKLLEQGGELLAASDAFREIADRFPYPNGVYWNDALLARARVQRRLGRDSDAERTLLAMVAHRERSAITGSYERNYDGAYFLLGEIAFDRGDWPSARERFEALADDFPQSRLRDDALWAAALASHRHGDLAAACAFSARLQREMPESRFSECTRLVCGTARPRGRCADYLQRAFKTGALRPDPTFR